MTFPAGRQLPVGRVTFCAGKRSVLCHAGLQKLKGLIMATGTYFFFLANWIGYPQGCVYRMTGQAIRVFKNCHGAVVLMAFSTLRNTSVFFRMTGSTFLLSMLTDLSLQAGSNLSMT